MPAPSTIEAFLELLQKSGIADPARLEPYILRLKAEAGLPNRPKELANQMLKDGLLTQFQARQLLQGKWRGFLFGKYKVLEQLGAGGMSSVYLCEHMLMRRHVAIKVLPVGKSQDQGTLARFYREARAAAALNHPHIARAFDVDQDGQMHFIVMEYIDGASLFDIVRKHGQMDVHRACHYIRQSAIGLQHIHENRLVHRDIKPGNLMVERQGNLKILDLGLARFFETGDDSSRDALTEQFDKNSMMGTADYISPEQAMNLHDVDIRADIYSLGATMYFLLAAQPPFQGKSVTQKLMMHQMKPPEPVTTHRSDVPAELSAVIDRMMKKEPADRFQTPAEVAEALSPWTQTPLARPPEAEMPKLCAAALKFSPESGALPASLSASGIRRLTPSRPPTPRSGVALNPLAVKDPLTDTAEVNLPVAHPETETEMTAASDTKVNPNRTTPAAPQPAVAPPTEAADSGPKTQRTARRKAKGKKKSRAWGNMVYLMAATAIVASIGGGFLMWSVMTGALERPLPPVVLPPDATGTQAKAPDAKTPPVTRSKPPGAVDPREAKPTPPPPPASGQRQPISVTKSGAAGTHPTIAAAIAKAQPGDKIVVQDDAHEEALTLDGFAPKNLVIEGRGGGRRVSWKLPAAQKSSDFLVRLSSVEGLTLRNFTLDGTGKVKDLVQLTGHCPGLKLEDLSCQSFTHCAVLFRGCSGGDQKPLTVQRVRSTTSKPLEAAFLFTAGPEGNAASSHHVQIQNCRFEGAYQGAITLAGPVTETVVLNNRFWKNGVAVRYKRAEPRPAAQVQVLGNTFADLDQALKFEAAPPAERGGFLVQNNLFVRVKQLAGLDQVQAVKPTRADGEWIWSEEGPVGTNVPAGARYFRKSFDLTALPIGGATLNIAGDDGFVVWLNGQRLGGSATPHFAQRVHAFDATPHLRKGKNILAVQVNNLADKLDSKLTTPAGLLATLADRSAADGKPLVVSDRTWRATAVAPEGWNQPTFDDVSWVAAKPWPANPSGWPWQTVVWDSVVQPQLPLGTVVPITAAGNLRDHASNEGFPSLESSRANVPELAADTAADTTFLRIGKGSPLQTAGVDKKAVGTP